MLLKSGVLFLFFLPVIESFDRSLGIAILFFGAILFAAPLIRNRKIDFDFVDLIFLLFLFFAGISTLLSISFSRSVIECSRYFAYYLIFAAIRNNPEKIESFKNFFKRSIIANSILLFLLFAIFALFKERISFEIPGMNLFYPSFGHNRIADILIFAIPIVLSFRLNKFLVLFFSVLLFVSFGRGAILSIAAGFAVSAFIFDRKKKWINKWAIIYFFLSIILISGVFLSTLFISSAKKEIQVYSPFYRPIAWDLRTEYFSQAIKGFIEKPIFGNGLDTFRYISRKYQSKQVNWSWYGHNHFFQLFSDVGLKGGIIFILFIAGLFILYLKRAGNEEDNINAGIFIALLASSIHSLIDYDWQFLSILLYVFWGFAILVPRKDEFESVSGNLFFFIFITQIGFGILLSFWSSERILKRTDSLIYRGKHKEALKLLDLEEKLDSGNYYVYKMKADLFEKAGHKEAANKYYEKAEKLFPLEPADLIKFNQFLR